MSRYSIGAALMAASADAATGIVVRPVIRPKIEGTSRLADARHTVAPGFVTESDAVAAPPSARRFRK